MRKGTEEALRESEERYRRLVETSPDGITYTDVEGRILFANTRMARLHGFEDPRELIGKSVGDLMAPEIRHQLKAQIEKTLATGIAENIETTLLRRDGSRFPALLSSVMVRDERGRPAGFVGFTRDISEQKKIRNEMEKNSRFIERAMSTTPEMIYIYDLDGMRNTYSNAGITRLLGYTAAQLRGMKSGLLGLLLHEDDRERSMRHFRYMRERAKDGEIVESEFRLKHADGRWRWLRSRESVFSRNPDGTAHEIIGASDDITEHKRDRENLEESYARLARLTDGIIIAITHLVEQRDPYTAGHQRHVSQLAHAIARDLGLPERQANGIRIAGLLHDVGKMNVPTEILAKPGRLNPFEYDIIKAHAELGYGILRSIAFTSPVAEVAYQHQERLDGSGYPRGLKAQDILFETKIVSVADVIEAMTFHRPYRPEIGLKRALQEIEEHKGTKYDAQAVEACTELFRTKRFQFT